MEAKELKKYLAADVSRIEKIMTNAGFHDFKTTSNELRCALPDMTNATGVMVKLNESLYTSLFELGYSGDLLGALSKVMDFSFRETVLFIHSILGIGMDSNKTKTVDPLTQLRQLSKGNVGQHSTKENKKYDETILNQFVDGVTPEFIQEGISPKVINQFHIMYDPRLQRIIFPHYDWIETDKIVGIKGRTTQSATEIEAFGTPKYWNYIEGYRKMSNLYGFNLAKDNLAKSHMIVLFEGEKSVLKQSTYNETKCYSVALGGHIISTAQVEFLLKQIPIDCEVVLAFDKDVMVKPEEGEEFIKAQAQKFKAFRKASYVYDAHNLLDEKDSPVDKGIKVWNYLLKWRKHI